MKIEVAITNLTGLLSLKVVHGNDSTLWDAKTYAKTKDYTSTFDELKVFEEINSFWATLPKNKQKEIYDVYCEIHHILDTYSDIDQIHNKITRLVQQLYELNPLEDIRHWVLFHSNIRFPQNLKESYGPMDPPDRTYLRSDYIELAVLAIAVRIMVPIWGEYISRTDSSFKEFMGMSLLHNSYIIQSPAMERLRLFIESSIKSSTQKGPSPTAILGGLGSSELPDWILALTVVRKLSIGEISVGDDTSNLITNIYQFVSYALKSMDRKFLKKFGGRVTEKHQPSGGNDDQKASIVEMYKVKQTVADGDLVVANVYTERVVDMALHAEPKLPMEYLDKCLESIRAMERNPILPHHITMIQWIMSKSLPARSIPLLSKPSLLRAMAATQAILWHWGFFELAGLVSAIPVQTSKDEMLASLESRGRIPKDLMAELQETFPYHQPPRGKQQTIRQFNVGAKAIDSFCELITKTDWKLNCPTDLVSQISSSDRLGKMYIPPDIRAQLAKLILKVVR